MSELTFNSAKPEHSVGFLLWQTTTLWQREIKSILSEHAISHAQFVILALLLWHQENEFSVSQSELVIISKMDKMTVSKALKELVLKHYVARSTAVEDTRTKVVILRAKGALVIKKLVPIIEAADDTFFASLSRHQQAGLCKLLSRLIK
mgnify:CR=1 FL=1